MELPVKMAYSLGTNSRLLLLFLCLFSFYTLLNLRGSKMVVFIVTIVLVVL